MRAGVREKRRPARPLTDPLEQDPLRRAGRSRRQAGQSPHMTTVYFHHPATLEHQTPLGHPERPDRIRAIERALEHERFAPLAREMAPMASTEALLLAHPEPY